MTRHHTTVNGSQYQGEADYDENAADEWRFEQREAA